LKLFFVKWGGNLSFRLNVEFDIENALCLFVQIV